MKRVVFLSDMHCGSKHGISPPEWQGNTGDEFYQGRIELWNWFSGEIDAIKAERPLDYVIFVGDVVDGQGRKSAGSEQTTTDWGEQLDCATSVIERIGADKYVFIMGTGYHVGDSCDYERFLARRFDATFWRKKNIEINGCIFNVRHHGGRSSIPYGMNSAAKSKFWNMYNALKGKEDNAHVVLRAHTHWFRYAGEEDWLAMLIPGLELPDTRYGARFEGGYSIGFVLFDVNDDGSYTWQVRLAKLEAEKVQTLKL